MIEDMLMALWIIAICEVIRALQNMVQLWHVKKSEKREINAYNEFFKRMKQSDREFVRNMLEEYEKMEADNDV
jgi:bifunctional pyridoxal-dependent enzyme with beta-cystathionase and maltose regulon repressor activities